MTRRRHRDHPAPLPLAPRSRLALAMAGVFTVIAFGWPLLATGTGTGRAEDAPLLFALLLPLVLAVVLAELSDSSGANQAAQGMDAKAVAMLGVLAAVGAALRPLGTGIAGFEPVFFLLVLAGRVFGPGFGFALGATTLFSSALITAGVGPWLPFQMLAAGWVAAGAGLLPRVSGRAELALLAGYGAATGLLYGLLLNLAFWPFAVGGGTAISFVAGDPLLDNLRRFLAYSLATSLGFDIPRALVTAALILLTGRPILGALRRASRRASFQAEPSFEPGPLTGAAREGRAAAPAPPPHRAGSASPGARPD